MDPGCFYDEDGQKGMVYGSRNGGGGFFSIEDWWDRYPLSEVADEENHVG